VSSTKLLLVLAWLFYLPLLVIGNVFVEERLVLLSIPINVVIFFALLLPTTILNAKFRRKKSITLAGLSLVPFLIAFLLTAALYSPDLEGVQKYLNLIILGYIGAVLLIIAHESGNLEILLKLMIGFLFILFICAVAYKSYFGFWRRDIAFFMNGSIVFGRNMCVGFFLSLFYLKDSKIYFALCICFIFGVLWSMSKGPIAGLLVCALFFMANKNKKLFFLYALIIGSFLAALINGAIDLSGTPFNRLQVGLQVLFGFSDLNMASGSINARTEMYIPTIELIKSNLFTGVGPGNWSQEIVSIFSYPHNLFLEAYSELGIVTGTILLVPLCLFLLSYKHQMFILPLFFLISHQFSGDMADARWLLLFSILIFSTGNNMLLQNSRTKLRAALTHP
jgi:hypothetical protein